MSEDTLIGKVKHAVRRSIRSGEYRIGDVLPPPELWAERIKCGPATVRKALVDLANEGLIIRKKRAGTMVARMPSAGRVQLLMSNEYHTNELLQEPIYTALVRQGYDVDIIPMLKDKALLEQQLTNIRNTGNAADFLVCLEPELGIRDILDHARNFERKVMFSLDDRPVAPDIHVISTDQQNAALKVAEHLLQLGHRKVAVCAGLSEKESSYANRSARYFQDLMKIGGAECIPLYLMAPRRQFETLRKQKATAYWGLTDHVTFLLLNLLIKHRIDVPEQVSLVGRNDTPWSRECIPPLTSVSWNPERIADAIVQALEMEPEQARNATISLAGPITIVEPDLVIRESTGKAP